MDACAWAINRSDGGSGKDEGTPEPLRGDELETLKPDVPVEQTLAPSRKTRRDDQSQIVDQAFCEQRTRKRQAAVDPDVTTLGLLEVGNDSRRRAL